MKTLLTFFTIVLFSFGASGEYNKKFTAEKCLRLFNIAEIFTDATFKRQQEALNDTVVSNLKGDILEGTLKLATGYATLYEVYCKN